MAQLHRKHQPQIDNSDIFATVVDELRQYDLTSVANYTAHTDPKRKGITRRTLQNWLDDDKRPYSPRFCNILMVAKAIGFDITLIKTGKLVAL